MPYISGTGSGRKNHLARKKEWQENRAASIHPSIHPSQCSRWLKHIKNPVAPNCREYGWVRMGSDPKTKLISYFSCNWWNSIKPPKRDSFRSSLFAPVSVSQSESPTVDVSVCPAVRWCPGTTCCDVLLGDVLTTSKRQPETSAHHIIDWCASLPLPILAPSRSPSCPDFLVFFLFFLGSPLHIFGTVFKDRTEARCSCSGICEDGTEKKEQGL